ncbi:ATP-binding protein [Aerosakkonemataceae cyanobacterium BLCC-F154]|uniref:histidine kinase n=1 Tax=Floridaenema fluviatile BLCC-F154 TaxID=3153640 RepID=A0ABV4Y4M1_9CYAN
MLSYQNFILRRNLSLTSFNGLRTLFGQMAQRVGEPNLLLTEDVLSTLTVRPPQIEEKFTLLVSEQFSGLMVATQRLEEVSWEDPEDKLYQVGLTFAPEAIAAFLTQLSTFLKDHPLAEQTFQQASQILRPNDANLQSDFTLSLLDIITEESKKNSSPDPIYPFVSVCQPVHEALKQQVEQERLLNQVTTQIRDSLELPEILETAVEQVRNFLQADRLLIYQFQQPLSSVKHLEIAENDILNFYEMAAKQELHPEESNLTIPENDNQLEQDFEQEVSDRKIWGRVTYEARASDEIPSVLGFSEEERCFLFVPNCREKYRKGFTLAVKDIETAYTFHPCILNLMRQNQVRAKLVVPILIQEQLWGLLIAHQCFEPRQWQDNEKKFLSHIAEHLAIAIYQAQLYAEVQQQKHTLEKRVIDRTQELHDAMLLAQSANRAKTEFLATMSHELRTPLTCVIGLSATLLRWSFGQLSQKQRDYLQSIHDNGEHLLELINDILELSQLEAGKTVLNISEFSLSQLAHQEMTNLKQKASQRGVELAVAIRLDSQQDRFLADDRRVRQILYNLLSNGIKFTPQGGRVILRVWREGNRAVLQVEDTGIGIPEHQKHLLFQKFQQLDSSYHRQYEGTGLGLALTKQLVELHGGRIEVNSTVGVGSIFTVWLPKQQYLATEKLSHELSSSYTKEETLINLKFPAGRIVVIENHEETATLICEILTAAGFQVVWLLEASTAMKQIEILQPVIVILDLQLSGNNGKEIVEQIRSLPGMQDVKILALTNKVSSDNLVLGANNYLLKPILPQSLLHKIQLLMANNIDE